MNILDEASRFHVTLVLKEGDELGTLTAMDYIEAVRMNRFRFATARHPRGFRRWHSNLMSFESGVQLETLKFKIPAGEAHRQIGIVETHIRLLKNQLSVMEDELPDASIDELVEHCVAAKGETTDV